MAIFDTTLSATPSIGRSAGLPHGADIAEMLDALEDEVDRVCANCPYELWIARACDATLRHAGGLEEDIRARFLLAAAAKGFYEPAVAPGFTLEPTEALCAHGLSYDCCACGCGE